MALVGIDLGTAYSVVATMEDGNIIIVDNKAGHRTTPSVVFFKDEECTLENAIAGEPAETSFIGWPDRGVRFVKRMMGRKVEKIDEQSGEKIKEKLLVRVGEKRYSPEQISAVILRKLVEDAEEYLISELGEDIGRITDAVITVPAWFGPEERSATEEAAKLAGLTVRALIPEPIAAAIDYAVHQKTDLASKTVFVFDLGGGTFDATVMRIERDQPDQPLAFWVLGKDGSIELGGSNWDQRLAEHVAEEYAAAHDGQDPRDDVATWDRLVAECEEAKRNLSEKGKDETTPVTCVYQGIPHTVAVSRAEFDTMTQPLMDEAMNKSNQLIERVYKARALAKQIAGKVSPQDGGAAVVNDAGTWNRLVTQCASASETLKERSKDGEANPTTQVRFHFAGQQQDQDVTQDDFDQAVPQDASFPAERAFQARALAKQIAGKVSQEDDGAAVLNDVGTWNKLVTECDAAAETLNTQRETGEANPTAQVRFDFAGSPQDQDVTQDDFDQAVAQGASFRPWGMIDEVLLVGGSTKMLEVQDRLVTMTGIKPRKHKGVDYNVARGAAIIAFTPEAWTSGSDEPIGTSSGTSSGTGLTTEVKRGQGVKRTSITTFDVVREGIGIQIFDRERRRDVNHVIIPAGTSIGEEYKESFGILEDGQTGVDFVIIGGDSTDLDRTRQLGMVTMEGLPGGTQSGEEVVVTLQVNKSGLIVGQGRHVRSGKTVPIQVDYFPE